jgi:uncharacterized protein (TIGR00251 family)
MADEEKATLDIEEDETGVTLKVHLQPRAHRDKIVGLHGDALKVQITAAPVEGQANDACVAFFARALKIPKAKVAIVSGLGSRDKRVRLSGITRAAVEALVPKP